MTTPDKDYYKIMGVSPDASMEEIRRVYRELSREYHPDKNRKRGSTKKFQDLNEAYQVLGNYQKRRAYDNEREGENEAMLPHDFFNFQMPAFFNVPMMFDFNMPNLSQMMNQPGHETGNFYSYSSTQTSRYDPRSGGMKTHKVVQVNDNGKKRNTVEKITHDRDGHVVNQKTTHPRKLGANQNTKIQKMIDNYPSTRRKN